MSASASGAGSAAGLRLCVWAALVAALVALALLAFPPHAERVPQEGEGALIERTLMPGGGVPVIRVSGALANTDGAAFLAAVDGLPHALVSLDSVGGSVSAALRIGAVIHRRGYATSVVSGALCYSACGLMWLAGAPRMKAPGASIGFHAAYALSSEGARVERGAPNALIGAYLADLGFSDALVWEVTRERPGDMTPLDAAFLARTGLHAVEVTDETAALARVGMPRAAGPAAVTLAPFLGMPAQTLYGTVRWTTGPHVAGQTAHIFAEMRLATRRRPVRVALRRNSDPDFDAAQVVEVSAGPLSLEALTGLVVLAEDGTRTALPTPFQWRADGALWLSVGTQHARRDLLRAVASAAGFSIAVRFVGGRTGAITLRKGANWSPRMRRALVAAL